MLEREEEISLKRIEIQLSEWTYPGSLNKQYTLRFVWQGVRMGVGYILTDREMLDFNGRMTGRIVKEKMVSHLRGESWATDELIRSVEYFFDSRVKTRRIYINHRRGGWPNVPCESDHRLTRFNELRAQGKKLGEINIILEQEGFSEVSGEGVMPAPTKHHQIVRENKGVKRMIQKGELAV